jgi:hypothetical protein
MRERTVVIRVTVDAVVPVPESWCRHQIGYHYNEQTSPLEAIDNAGGFVTASAEYLREAEPLDEEDCEFKLPEDDGLPAIVADKPTVPELTPLQARVLEVQFGEKRTTKKDQSN